MKEVDKEMVTKAVRDLETVVEVLKSHNELEAAEKIELLIQQLTNSELSKVKSDQLPIVFDDNFLKIIDPGYKILEIIRIILEWL